MIRTTIFLSDQMHEELRREAFRSKRSMAEVIRAKLARDDGQPRKRKMPADPLLKVAGACRGPVLSRDIDDLYGE